MVFDGKEGRYQVESVPESYCSEMFQGEGNKSMYHIKGRPRQLKSGYLMRYKKNPVCSGSDVTSHWWTTHQLIRDDSDGKFLLWASLGDVAVCREKLFGRDWREEFVVLYEDSTLAWFKDQLKESPSGGIWLQDAPELMAMGAFTLRVPARPDLPGGTHIKQLMAFGVRKKRKVYWFLASNEDEVNDWMTAISNTLPMPFQAPVYNQMNDHVSHIYETVDIPSCEQIKHSASTTPATSCEPIKRDGSSIAGETQIVPAPTPRHKDAIGELATGVMLATGLTQWGWGYGWGSGFGWWNESVFKHSDVAVGIHSVEYYRPDLEYQYEDNEFPDHDFDMDFGGDFGF